MLGRLTVALILSCLIGSPAATAPVQIVGADSLVNVDLLLPDPGFQRAFLLETSSPLTAAVVELIYEHRLTIAATGAFDGANAYGECFGPPGCSLTFGPPLATQPGYPRPTAEITWNDRQIAVIVRNPRLQHFTDDFYSESDFLPFDGSIEGYLTDDSGSWTFTTFDAVAVPEPATWLLLIAGLAGIGAVARRRAQTRP